jgi:Ca2+-binding RTX toxin-like protein
MKTSFLMRFISFGAFTLILFSGVTAVAATNTVPSTSLDDRTSSINRNNVKPSACAGISVTNLITGTGVITGTTGNDLILASFDIDIIDGSGGNDCIVGGDANDVITGGDGNDICLGGPGTDVFATCESESQ